MTEKLCTKHHFGKDERCTVCQMRLFYYADAMAKLDKWSPKDRRTSDYQSVYDSFQCKPHSHDPLAGLYQMEAGQ